MFTIKKRHHNVTDSYQPQAKEEDRFFWKRCVRGSGFQPSCKLHSKVAGSSLEKMPCNSDQQECPKVDLVFIFKQRW